MIKIELNLEDIMNDYLADCRGGEYGLEEGTSIERVVFHNLVMDVENHYKEYIKEAIKDVVNIEIKDRYRTFAGSILSGILDEMIDEDEVRSMVRTRITNIISREMQGLVTKTADEAIEPYLDQIKSKTKSAVRMTMKDVLNSTI